MLLNLRDDFGTEAASQRRFVYDYAPSGFLDRCGDRRQIKRH
jgi:hypothetical protein